MTKCTSLRVESSSVDQVDSLMFPLETIESQQRGIAMNMTAKKGCLMKQANFDFDGAEVNPSRGGSEISRRNGNYLKLISRRTD